MKGSWTSNPTWRLLEVAPASVCVAAADSNNMGVIRTAKKAQNDGEKRKYLERSCKKRGKSEEKLTLPAK